MNIQWVGSPNYGKTRFGNQVEYIVCPMQSTWYNILMKYIPVGKAYKTKVDDDYIESKPSLSWQYSGGYAKRQHQTTVDGKRHYIREYLHRTIMGAKDGDIVDHINGDTLDNRKENLRLSNKVLNALNSDKVYSKSGYRNVTWSKQAQKWHGIFAYNKKRYHCGTFDTAEQASQAVQNKKEEVIKW